VTGPFLKSGMTRSEAYFLTLFRAATLRAAVERAANHQRQVLFEEATPIPVPVEKLAALAGLRIAGCIEGARCEEGRLLPTKGGFLVQLKEGLTLARRRFALAHELGHTFFYRDDGKGPRHQVGVVSGQERRAEERICNLFAGAFLMPASGVRAVFARAPDNSPWAVLALLDRACRRLQVSPDALIIRLGSLELDFGSYLVLCFRYRENEITGRDPRLRIAAWCALGGLRRKLCTWRNRSARGIGLESAEALFEAWRGQLSGGVERDGGRYVWDATSGLRRLVEGTEVCANEKITVDLVGYGRWQKRTLHIASASCLYAWRGCGAREAYVVAAVSLVEGPGALTSVQG